MADPDQTASSGSSLFAILTSILRFQPPIISVLFENRMRKVFEILEHLPIISILFENRIRKMFEILDLVSLFDLILYVPSTIFQLNKDGSSWVKLFLS